MIKKFSRAPLLALALLAPLHAAGADYVYLPVPPETLIAQIPPPPADGSPAGMADVETMLQVQKDRTPAQAARASHAVTLGAMQMGANVFGPGFTKENLPFTARFLGDANLERHEVLEVAKGKWNRVRPYDRGLGITLCVKRPQNTSYPSGHSAAAANWAVLYTALFPEYKKFFEDDMRETMWCRVLGGAHYPSDTQAGRKLGTLIGGEMLKNPVTQEAVKKARAEIEAFLKAHPQARERAQKLLEAAEPPVQKTAP